ncbi:hypothetical protein HYU13_04975 [Candidatus Woesearchaeota archaeon]|nr:hypothetical protein [Candidatus Woesearchaeota archaeon]
MDVIAKLQAESAKRMNIADHMFSVTYPMVKDPKLLMTVLDNMFLAFTHAMQALLAYERTFKRVPPYQDTFVSQFNAFKAKVMPRYALDAKIISSMQEVREILTQHKKSTVEFIKDDTLAICSENYRTQTTISSSKIRESLAGAKRFIGAIDTIIMQQKELFEKEAKGAHGRVI